MYGGRSIKFTRVVCMSLLICSVFLNYKHEHSWKWPATIHSQKMGPVTCLPVLSRTIITMLVENFHSSVKIAYNTGKVSYKSFRQVQTGIVFTYKIDCRIVSNISCAVRWHDESSADSRSKREWYPKYASCWAGTTRTYIRGELYCEAERLRLSWELQPHFVKL